VDGELAHATRHSFFPSRYWKRKYTFRKLITWLDYNRQRNLQFITINLYERRIFFFVIIKGVLMFLFFQPLNQRVIVQLFFFCLATICAYLYVFSFSPLYILTSHTWPWEITCAADMVRGGTCASKKKVISTQKARRKEIMWFLEAPHSK